MFTPAALAAFAALGVAPPGVFPTTGAGPFRLPAGKTVALVFLGHDCPVSNGYAPELNRLAAEYAPRGVVFAAVYADADLSLESARRHTQAFGLTFPAVFDPGLALARKYGATVKPEAVVLTPAGDIAYRGRVDDVMVKLGRRRAAPTRRDLALALDAVLAGTPVAVPRAPAIGCDIDFPDATPRK